MPHLADVIQIKPQRKPIADACRWLEAFETLTLTHVRLGFVWPRIWLRAIWRV